MPKYLVRQRRPVWVCYIQEVEAESEDAAIDTFYETFDPQHTIMECQVQRVEHGPVTVWDANLYPDPTELSEED